MPVTNNPVQKEVEAFQPRQDIPLHQKPANIIVNGLHNVTKISSDFAAFRTETNCATFKTLAKHVAIFAVSVIAAIAFSLTVVGAISLVNETKQQEKERAFIAALPVPPPQPPVIKKAVSNANLSEVSTIKLKHAADTIVKGTPAYISEGEFVEYAAEKDQADKEFIENKANAIKQAQQKTDKTILTKKTNISELKRSVDKDGNKILTPSDIELAKAGSLAMSTATLDALIEKGLLEETDRLNVAIYDNLGDKAFNVANTIIGMLPNPFKK